ncbi:MAG: hypothetical protein GX146_06250 [Myxococcales bacterium]|jgi:CxxC-x17-CxxC domain-containing protein|nr:hypothetical protein [Myxococcales bacterium]
MAFEDQTLQCVMCGVEFVFSAGEQQFHQEKGFTAQPKRCPGCRAAKKQRTRKQKQNQFTGEYRSPAFDGSAPRQLRQDTHAARQRNRYGDYRSPSFRDQKSHFDEEYRSPAFRDIDAFNPQDEYRSPGFQEYENIRPEEEYRSPAFGNTQAQYRDERPLFQITCVACGEDAMVPFIPEEKEDPMCQGCYREHKEMLKKEAAALAQRAQQEAEAAAEAAGEAQDLPTATIGAETADSADE